MCSTLTTLDEDGSLWANDCQICWTKPPNSTPVTPGQYKLSIDVFWQYFFCCIKRRVQQHSHFYQQKDHDCKTIGISPIYWQNAFWPISRVQDNVKPPSLKNEKWALVAIAAPADKSRIVDIKYWLVDWLVVVLRRICRNCKKKIRNQNISHHN